MTTFPIHNAETAPAGAQPILEAVQKSMGSIPNLFGVFASSPALLKAYTSLADLQDKETAFDETERQLVFLTVSVTNDCEYCVAAHSTIASMKGVPAEVATAVRDGSALPTAKLEALRTFARTMVEQRGWVGREALEAFLAAGYTQQHVLEVVLAVAFKTLSNFTNHIAATPLDDAFAPQAWSRTAASNA